MGSDETLLDRAAIAYGIELQYSDVFGNVHRASDDVKRALLAVLGVSAATDADLERVLAAERAARESLIIDPVMVVRDDHQAIRLRVPKSLSGATIKLELEWEGGELEHHWYWLPELPAWDPSHSDEGDKLAKRLPLPKLRLGYHQLRVLQTQGQTKDGGLVTLAEARLIVCPPRTKTVDRRYAGFGLSLYGVRSARNWGCGDFTDLKAIIDQLAPAGAAFIGLNPLHAIANRQPYNTSPYLPECALYRNFIYLDVERASVDAGYKIAYTEQMRAEIAALRATEFVEYERIAQLKLAVLGEIFQHLSPSQDFERFIVEQGLPLADYATYCALYEEMRRRYPDKWLWTDWPEEYRDPRSPAVAAFAREHHDRVRFFQFLQWQLSVQAAAAHAHAKAAGMAIGLYHDLALATDRYGCDLWAHRPFYSVGCRVGAPPDELGPQGQDWGFPPPNRDAHRRDGYHLFAQSIRQAAQAGGALRIDHVMRFLRLYWIPEAFSATAGTYVRDYASDLLGVLALESARGDFVVVGEDLGTVTDEARQTLGAAGVLGYRLLWFEKDGQGNFKPPDQYTSQALASITTHDLATLAGFMLGRDIEARKAANLVDDAAYWSQKHTREDEVGRLRQALERAGFAGNPLGFILATPCLLAMINYEDLSGETEQQNLPGSTWQHPNWRRKWSGTVEEMAPLAQRFRELVAKSGRVPNR